MNSITVSGSLGKDAELKQMNSGDYICNFSIADSMGKDKGTIWWNCSLFGKRAESLAPYLVKGQAVTVSGTITEREWTDKEGAQRKSMDVRVNDVALQGGRRDSDGQSQEKESQRYDTPKPAAQPPVDEDLPF
jgi:single-strand DNA-binding protein